MATSQTTLAKRAEQAGNKVELPVANGLPLAKLVRESMQCAREDRLSSFAGSIAYRTIFACFPCLFTLFWFVEAFGGSSAVNRMLGLLTTSMPKAAGDAVKQQFTATTNSQASGALTIGAVVALAFSIWALLLTMRAVMEALNAMYQRKEHRPAWKRYATAFLLSIAAPGLLIGSLVLVVFGTSLAQHIGTITGYGPVLRWAWVIATWPVLAVAVVAAFALVYYFAPDLDQKFRWISDGSVIAAILWLLFAIGFSIYINNFASPTHTYGALAGIAILMVYVYVAAYIMLLGAEMNRVIESHRRGEQAPRRG